MPSAGAAPQQRPTARRPFFSLPRALFALFLALAAPAMVAFAWQRGVATIEDDSVSYIALARHMLPGTDPHLDRWIAWRANFPPVFPMLLAATGGATDLLVGHLVVAACAIAAFFVVWRLAAHLLASEGVALGVVALFALAPNTWISMKGILSEPLFLCLSLATLLFFDRTLGKGEGSAMRWLAFGALLALTVLTRVAGAALVIAFAVHAAWRWGRAPRRGLVPLAFSVLPVIALTLLWIALRPHGAPDNYQSIGAKLYRAWLGQPAANAGYAWRVLVDSWIASFTAQGDVGPTARAVLEGLGIVALAGAVRAAMRNRLDGWYVLASIAITYFWVFGEDNTRRLLYPLVPLALVHAAQIVLAMARAVPAPRLRPVIVGAVALVPAAVCLPAMMLLADKARERAPVIAGSHYRYADIVEFYTVIRRERARAEAGHTLAVLAGLEALAHVTPPEAKVMWIRPEYVAILGGRDAEPYLLSWDAARRDREVLERRVDYIVRSWVYKTDLDGVKADAVKFLAGVERYCETVMRIDNPAADYRAFELLKVDRAKLAERVAAESR